MKFSAYYNLKKTQYELDFVDIFIEKDTKLFIDPWAIRQGEDDFLQECYEYIADFFELLINKIKEKDYYNAKDMLRFCHEVREIRLGDSIDSYAGLGMNRQTDDLFEALKKSNAIKTGLLSDIEDCALMIDNINRDKISDMIANIIKIPLIKYTQQQCILHNIKLSETKVSVGYCWDNKMKDWDLYEDYLPVPELNGKPQQIILTPKKIVRRDLVINYQDFYRNEILNFEQARHSHAGVSLAKTLKSGQKKITKEELKKIIPGTKKHIYETTINNPELLEKYKNRKAKKFKIIKDKDILSVQKEKIDLANEIKTRIKQLSSFKTGKKDAYRYHDFIIGILQLIFSPDLTNLKKEDPIAGGSKFVDITFSNVATSGFFMDIVRRTIPSQKIFFECKNYSEDIKNPEIDQMSGRLGCFTTKIGFLICRKIEDKKKFIQRAKFILNNKGEYIIGLTDEDIITLLNLKEKEERGYENEISNFLTKKLEELLPS